MIQAGSQLKGLPLKMEVLLKESRFLVVASREILGMN